MIISYELECDLLFQLEIQEESTVHMLSPNSDENEISLYIIPTICSNIQVMRIKTLINKDKMS